MNTRASLPMAISCREAAVPFLLKNWQSERLILVRRPAAPGMYGNLVDGAARPFTPLVVAEVEQMLTAINLVPAAVGISLVLASIREI